MVVGTLELVRSEGDMPLPHQQEIATALTRLETVITLVGELHALVKGLEPTP
jgi:hypothetical protein